MGMVVRSNIMALNANRQLGLNNSQVSKSLEKLSSGYKINRAGDDASGLAISEKMKAQIKGLETASANSQDGISLVQTAEGALTEVHDMLNRMVELAGKAANGTIDNETDRAALQKEMNALLDEIDRIADSTDFNGIKLLNGDHTLTITATDAKNESTVRTLSFDKAMHSVEFEQTVAMAADDMPTKALVNIQGSFPTGSTLQVWICNNGNDAEPTWEDITTKALTSQKHFFTNQTKTAASWGVKIKVKLLRGSAEGDCYIQSVGGNFA